VTYGFGNRGRVMSRQKLGNRGRVTLQRASNFCKRGDVLVDSAAESSENVSHDLVQNLPVGDRADKASLAPGSTSRQLRKLASSPRRVTFTSALTGDLANQ